MAEQARHLAELGERVAHHWVDRAGVAAAEGRAAVAEEEMGEALVAREEAEAEVAASLVCVLGWYRRFYL